METYILKCSDLSKKYRSVEALDHVNLNLQPGRFVGLLGPNGSGKTTLMKILAGILSPTSGTVEICGHPIGKDSKMLVSYLPDTDYLPEQSIIRTMDIFSEFFTDFDRTKAITMLSDLKIDTKQSPKKLSKGNREKLQLVLAMSRKAKLYLLDEPIGGIDPASRDYILHTILENYSEDATVLLSTHLIGDVESVLDDAIFLKEGKIHDFRSTEELRDTERKSVDAYFREVFKC